MADTETPETTSPASYRYWIDETVRFADLDPVGHVNNAAISTYFESARVALFHDSGNSPVSGPRSVVIARLTIDFRAELHYPDRIRIGLRVTRFGRSSLTLAGAVFRGDTCIATSEAICVIIDVAERRSVEIPADVRTRLTELAG
ncbi:acyl-CoA thioesterase [Skermanella sp. TT6]|uniref:Acyl-CoA thioesterase n=1 Tax=Skermanella cutis TaxID=2775420 RepID=A0ABX7B816_9PROT|nr:thioesterase family protein [Skermanella sp. TT6]QQP89745.1 acyl-CoA thioesterase [Skermanella sp. TT6]